MIIDFKHLIDNLYQNRPRPLRQPSPNASQQGLLQVAIMQSSDQPEAVDRNPGAGDAESLQREVADRKGQLKTEIGKHRLVMGMHAGQGRGNVAARAAKAALRARASVTKVSCRVMRARAQSASLEKS